MATRDARGHAGPPAVESGYAPAGEVDAVTLLKADHRRFEHWLAQLRESRDARGKEDLAAHICNALEVHAQIEEEIFYPAYVDAGGAASRVGAAADDHEVVRRLIMQIRHSPGAASDPDFDVHMTELAAIVGAHMRDEERSGGLFEQAEAMGMDLDLLGPELQRRRNQLLQAAGEASRAAAERGAAGAMNDGGSTGV